MEKTQWERVHAASMAQAQANFNASMEVDALAVVRAKLASGAYQASPPHAKNQTAALLKDICAISDQALSMQTVLLEQEAVEKRIRARLKAAETREPDWRDENGDLHPGKVTYDVYKFFGESSL